MVGRFEPGPSTEDLEADREVDVDKLFDRSKMERALEEVGRLRTDDRRILNR